MPKKNVDFKWYVMNETSFNQRKIEPWNIFNNIVVYEDTCKLCKDFKAKNMKFADFVEELRTIVMCQLWSRCQYEIIVSSLFDRDGSTEEKIDCYAQVLPNIEILAKYVLQTYYPRLDMRTVK